MPVGVEGDAEVEEFSVIKDAFGCWSVGSAKSYPGAFEDTFFRVDEKTLELLLSPAVAEGKGALQIVEDLLADVFSYVGWKHIKRSSCLILSFLDVLQRLTMPLHSQLHDRPW